MLLQIGVAFAKRLAEHAGMLLFGRACGDVACVLLLQIDVALAKRRAEHAWMLHCANRLGVIPLWAISCSFEKGVWPYA